MEKREEERSEKGEEGRVKIGMNKGEKTGFRKEKEGEISMREEKINFRKER